MSNLAGRVDELRRLVEESKSSSDANRLEAEEVVRGLHSELSEAVEERYQMQVRVCGGGGGDEVETGAAGGFYTE